MKIIDKLIIIAVSIGLLSIVDWKTPLPFLGFIPIIYATGYLILRGFEDEDVFRGLGDDY